MNQIKSIINRFYTDPAFFGTVIVTAGIMISSIFSYVMQILLAKFLTVEQYGTFNALISLVNILLVPGSVIAISLVKVSSELKANENFKKLTKLFWLVNAGSLASGLIVIAVFVYLKFTLSEYFKIENPDYFLYLGIFLASSFITIAPGSYLQGLLRFKAFTFFNIFSMGARVVLVLLFVYWGWGVQGIFSGMSIAGILSFLVSILLLNKNFRSFENVKVSENVRKLLFFSAPVLLVNLGMMLLNNLDIILVKKFLDATEAGHYGSVVNVGKVVLFGAGTVAVVMFPQITQLFTQNKSYTKLLSEFLVLQILVVVGSVAVFFIFPHQIISIMFGSKFLPAVSLLPKFAVFMGLYVLINFFITFFLAIDKTGVFLFQIPAVILQAVLLSVWHESLDMVININILVSFCLLLALVVYYLRLPKVKSE